MNNENKDIGRYKLIKDTRKKRDNLMKGSSPALNALTLLNEQDDLGRFPLHLSVLWDWEHICKILLEASAKVNVTDSVGDTPLMLAAAAGNQPIVEVILEYNPDLHLVSQAEKTALDLSKTRGIRRLLGKYMIEGALPAQEIAEGLSRFFMPDLLEDQVHALLRRLKVPLPAKMQVVLDPVNGRPLGYAHVDFWDEDEAKLLVSHRAVQLNLAQGFINVRFVMEGPRPPDHDHYAQQ